MTYRLPLVASFLLAFAAPAVAQTAAETLQPFAALRAGYAAHDGAAAARAYADDAVVIYAYEELPREEHVGADAIRASFERALAQVRPEWTVDVNFKLDPAAKHADERSGVYRILIDTGARRIANYGRFDVTLRKVGRRWLFARDTATSATVADYDAIPGEALFAG